MRPTWYAETPPELPVVICSSVLSCLNWRLTFSANQQEKVSAGIPLKRLGKPEEVAGMTRFLALDPAADYITGHCFNVDGGIAMGA